MKTLDAFFMLTLALHYSCDSEIICILRKLIFYIHFTEKDISEYGFKDVTWRKKTFT